PDQTEPSDSTFQLTDKNKYLSETLPTYSKKAENYKNIELTYYGKGILLLPYIKQYLEENVQKPGVEISNIDDLDSIIECFEHVVLPNSSRSDDGIDVRIRLLTDVHHHGHSHRKQNLIITMAFKSSVQNGNKYETDAQDKNGYTNTSETLISGNSKDVFLNTNVIEVENVSQEQYQSSTKDQQEKANRSYLSILVQLAQANPIGRSSGFSSRSDVTDGCSGIVADGFSHTSYSKLTSHYSSNTRELSLGSMNKGEWKVVSVSVHRVTAVAIDEGVIETLTPDHAAKLIEKAAKQRARDSFGTTAAMEKEIGAVPSTSMIQQEVSPAFGERSSQYL
uniref:hypothetical protein n=1 Tax=Wolbachia endosymbiont of Pentidionis agamae TaxID=3110435 RepID=UPI002FD1A05A